MLTVWRLAMATIFPLQTTDTQGMEHQDHLGRSSYEMFGTSGFPPLCKQHLARVVYVFLSLAEIKSSKIIPWLVKAAKEVNFLHFNCNSQNKGSRMLKCVKEGTQQSGTDWPWMTCKSHSHSTQLSNWCDAFLSTSDNLCAGSQLEREERRQVSHLVQKQAVWYVAASVPGLWKKTGHVARLLSTTIPEAWHMLSWQVHPWAGDTFCLCGCPLERRSEKLQACCTACLTQHTREERVQEKHFLFTSHLLSFAMTLGTESTAFVKTTKTTCLGNFYSGCFLIWAGSILEE